MNKKDEEQWEKSVEKRKRRERREEEQNQNVQFRSAPEPAEPLSDWFLSPIIPSLMEEEE